MPEPPFKLPLKVEPVGATAVTLVDATGYSVAVMDNRPREWMDNIALCVNAHAGLVEACKLARGYLASVFGAGPLNPNAQHTMGALTDALALADPAAEDQP